MVRVILISPYPALRAGLRSLLGAEQGIEVVGEFDTPRSFSEAATRGVDVIVAESVGIYDVERELVKIGLLAGVVVLGDEFPRERYLAGGVRPVGYLPREAEPEQLASAVHAVAQGLVVVDPVLLALRAMEPETSPARSDNLSVGERLTPRELEVLQLIAAGLPNKTIALRLDISDHTVKFHVSSVLAKLGASSRTEAVSTAARLGLLIL